MDKNYFRRFKTKLARSASRTHTKDIPKGTTFSRLTVVSTYKKDRHTWAKCKCSCGKVVHKSANALKNGHTRSCGCLLKDTRGKASITHGCSTRGNPYYRAGTAEYRTWAGIKSRCADKEDSRYGGRGIRMCLRWQLSFVNFLDDVGKKPTPNHTLGRIDNDGHYEPGNVKWETYEEQAANKRSTRYLVCKGKRQALFLWARESGINQSVITDRLSRGWDVEKAIFTPKKVLKRR